MQTGELQLHCQAPHHKPMNLYRPPSMSPSSHIPNPLPADQEPPEPHPEGKTYFSSLRSIPSSTSRYDNAASPEHGEMRPSVSMGSLPANGGGRALVDDRKHGCHRGRSGTLADYNSTVSRNQDAHVEERGQACPQQFPSSKSCASVRFSPENASRNHQAVREDVGVGMREDDVRRREEEQVWDRAKARATAERGAERDAVIAGGMRRGSEVASWAACGTINKSSRDYLW